jgi:hypothetical protein
MEVLSGLGLLDALVIEPQGGKVLVVPREAWERFVMALSDLVARAQHSSPLAVLDMDEASILAALFSPGTVRVVSREVYDRLRGYLSTLSLSACHSDGPEVRTAAMTVLADIFAPDTVRVEPESVDSPKSTDGDSPKEGA